MTESGSANTFNSTIITTIVSFPETTAENCSFDSTTLSQDVFDSTFIIKSTTLLPPSSSDGLDNHEVTENFTRKQSTNKTFFIIPGSSIEAKAPNNKLLLYKNDVKNLL